MWKLKKWWQWNKIFLKDKETEQVMKKEVKIWKELRDHPNIVKFIDAAIHKSSKGNYLYILSEICSDGHLLDLLEKYNGRLKESQIMLVLKHVVRGIKYMHQQDPPIAHRDIKVENILLHRRNFKLCDFGSASEHVLDPSKSNDRDIDDEMEKYEKYTTFMYRPPEMIDKYRGWTVGLKVDIWMLGCVLFALWFFKHPFQDAQKLAILNAHYFFPTDNESKKRINEKLRDLIRHMLTPNPKYRPDINEVEDLLETWEDHDHIDINQDAQKLKDEELRRAGVRVVKQKTSKKDISEDEIRKFQHKLKKQKLEEQKKHQVPFHSNYNQKMQEELSSKPKKSPAQSDDFDWDFGQQSKSLKNNPIIGTNQTQKHKKGTQPRKVAQKQSDFDFDFDSNSQQTKKVEPKQEVPVDDFFGFSENQYWTKPAEDDWFDNSQSKPKVKAVVAAPAKVPVIKASQEFDFGFDSQPPATVEHEDLFDFGTKDINEKKPVFEDYFPGEWGFEKWFLMRGLVLGIVGVWFWVRSVWWWVSLFH